MISGGAPKSQAWMGREWSPWPHQYHRLAGRRGKKRAIVAVGHSLLVVAYHLLKNGVLYEELGEELGGDFFDRLNEERVTRHAVKRLETLGYKVNLERAAA